MLPCERAFLRKRSNIGIYAISAPPLRNSLSFFPELPFALGSHCAP